MRARNAVVWPLLALAALPSCNLDTDDPAPYVDPPTTQGACGTTETLIPQFLQFVTDDRFAPLREVLDRRFVPSEYNPNPDPSLRTILDAIVRLITQLGLSDTAYVAHLAASAEVEEELGPLVVHMLGYVDGRLDGTPHYDATDSAAHFIRVCEPDHLLSAIEGLLRFRSPSADKAWIVAVIEEIGPLLDEPELTPFIEGFEQSGETGRPAIISLLRQIMAFVADDDFAISRVETLLMSAVYPNVGPSLETRIERLVELLGEATAPEAGILVPLQGAMRCGMQHGEHRDELIGFVYDLTVSEEVGLKGLIDGIGFVASDVVAQELDLLADVIAIVRTDLTLRDEIRELLATLISSPDAELVVPVLIDLFEEKIVTELLAAVVQLLDGCGR